MEIAFFQGDLERLHVEPVAGENAAVIAPTGVGRGPPAARVGAIDDVVMNQRGTVKQLNNGRQPDGAAAILVPASCVPMTQQKKRGAQALPSPAQKIGGDFRNRWEG
jgi:hypothetical protein